MELPDPNAPPVTVSTLLCLGGLPPPAEIAADLALLPQLPAAAKQGLYRLLGPCLGEDVPASIEEALGAFCRAFEVDDGAMARAIRASRFLLREAAGRDLSAASFAEDLGKLELGSGRGSPRC